MSNNPVTIVRLENGRYCLFDRNNWDGEANIPYLHVGFASFSAEQDGVHVQIGDAPLEARDVDGRSIHIHHDQTGYVTEIRTDEQDDVLQSVNIEADSRVWFFLYGMPDRGVNQTSPAEHTEKRKIDPEPSEGKFKIYRDLDGEWCMNRNRVGFNILANTDVLWVSGLYGEIREVYLAEGEQRIHLTVCAGKILQVFMVDLTGVHPEHCNNPDNWKRVEGDSFELDTGHVAFHHFEYEQSTAVL